MSVDLSYRKKVGVGNCSQHVTLFIYIEEIFFPEPGVFAAIAAALWQAEKLRRWQKDIILISTQVASTGVEGSIPRSNPKITLK